MCVQLPDDLGYYVKWLSLSDVRRSLHVGNLSYHDGGKVEKFLLTDLMQSVKAQLAETMNFYKVRLCACFQRYRINGGVV